MLKIIKSSKIYADIAAFFALLLVAMMISVNKKYQIAVLDGISLWAGAILPAMFPYLIIITLLSALKSTAKIPRLLSPVTTRMFNVNGNVGFALFLSVLCGYPVGAQCVSDLKNRDLIGDAESIRAAALCSSSSPVFLIASVGNITFGNSLFGLLLFATHLISLLIVGFVFAFYKRKESPKSLTYTAPPKNDNLFYDSVYSAVISVLVVGGIISIFYLLTEMLADIGVIGLIADIIQPIIHDNTESLGIVNGFFECTKGLKILASGGISRFTLPVAAAICGFGGISVIMQSLAYLKKAQIKTAPFLISKTLAAVINFIIGLTLSAIFLA